MEKWRVLIFKDGEMAHLGYFDEKKTALRYDEEATPLGKYLDFPKAGAEAKTAKSG